MLDFRYLVQSYQRTRLCKPSEAELSQLKILAVLFSPFYLMHKSVSLWYFA